MYDAPQGDTPLLLATKRGMSDIVKLLLEHRVESNRKDKVEEY